VCSERYFWWLQLQRCGGLTGVWVAAVSQAGAHSMKRPSCGLIRIQSHRADMFVEPRIGVVEKVRKMITKSGKSWGVYSKLQVTREWITVNFHVPLKIYPAAYGWLLQWIPIVLRFAVSRSNDVCCLFAGLHWSERQLMFHVRWIYKGNSSTEMLSGDVCPNTLPGSYMKHTLTVMSCCTFSFTIPNEMTVKMQNLLCLNWSYVRTFI